MQLSKLLVLFTLISGVTTVGKPTTKTHINYVALGASQAAGYGLRGFIPEEMYDDPVKIFYQKDKEYTPNRDGFYSSGYLFHSEKAYPELVKSALEEKLGEGNVTYEHRVINSLRAYDLAYILDPTLPFDGYLEWRLGNGEEGTGWMYDINRERNEKFGANEVIFTKEETNLRAEFMESITKADLITYDLGANDFGSYITNMIEGELGLTNNVEAIMSGTALKAYSFVKGLLEDNVVTNLIGKDNDIVKTVTNIADTLAYAYAAFTVGFDRTMETIYRVNPDVEVIVLGIQNPLKDFAAKLSILEANVGPIYDVVIGLANLYTHYISQYASKYYYVDFATEGNVETFRDELLRWDGKVENLTSNIKDCFNVFEYDFQVESNINTYVNTYAASIISAYNNKADKSLTKDSADGKAVLAEVKERLVNAANYELATAFKKVLEKPTIDVLNTDRKQFNELKALLTKEPTTTKKGLFSFGGKESATKVIDEVIAAVAGADEDNSRALAAVDKGLESLFKKDAFTGGLLFHVAFNYANCFFLHANEAGHEAIAAKIMKCYEEKKISRFDFLYDTVESTIANYIKQFADKLVADFEAKVVEIEGKTNDEVKELAKEAGELKIVLGLMKNLVEKFGESEVASGFDSLITTVDGLTTEINKVLYGNNAFMYYAIELVGKLFEKFSGFGA